jgi:PAS domain S-box-containing protein
MIFNALVPWMNLKRKRSIRDLRVDGRHPLPDVSGLHVKLVETHGMTHRKEPASVSKFAGPCQYSSGSRIVVALRSASVMIQMRVAPLRSHLAGATTPAYNLFDFPLPTPKRTMSTHGSNLTPDDADEGQGAPGPHSDTHQQLEASEIRYRRLFEAARDGILILDAKTAKIIDVNPFMLDLLDYPRAHFIGKELWEIGVFPDKEQSKTAMRRLQEEKSIRFENMPLKDKSGNERPVEFVSNVYQEDHHPVIQCNIRDISERKRFEDERA